MIAEKTRERPIIFTGESPKWILDGRKTMTRRVIKFKELSNIKKGRLFYSTTFNSWAIEGGEADIELVKCPYGKPGDHLWVKESVFIDEDAHKHCKVARAYKSDGDILPKSYKWTSSRFMPRWASRINLEITNIRVERLTEIQYDPDDMEAEGITAVTGCSEHLAYEFKELWNKINKKRGYGWDVNPWVWVIEFRRLK